MRCLFSVASGAAGLTSPWSSVSLLDAISMVHGVRFIISFCESSIGFASIEEISRGRSHRSHLLLLCCARLRTELWIDIHVESMTWHGRRTAELEAEDRGQDRGRGHRRSRQEDGEAARMYWSRRDDRGPVNNLNGEHPLIRSGVSTDHRLPTFTAFWLLDPHLPSSWRTKSPSASSRNTLTWPS